MKCDIAEFRRIGLTIVAFVVVGATTANAAETPAHLGYANGVSATVYGADDLASRLTTYQGLPAIELPDGRMLPVVTDINDPSISNRGDGVFHPFTLELVDRVLASIDHPRMPLSMRIYLLPYPRHGVLVSSTSGSEMFLSPHVLDIDPAVAAYIIAHELGHVFHNRFMRPGASQWREYREMRGIADESTFNESAPHAYRPREIFAEDFRVLFGGREAYFDGHIENSEIAGPEAVPGLKSFYLAVVNARPDARIAASSSPNPFNPETEIRISLPPDAGERGTPVTVRVYSVTGALVRELYDGAPAGDLAVQWDGRDSHGNPVASATYYAQIRMGDERTTLKLMLLK